MNGTIGVGAVLRDEGGCIVGAMMTNLLGISTAFYGEVRAINKCLQLIRSSGFTKVIGDGLERSNYFYTFSVYLGITSITCRKKHSRSSKVVSRAMAGCSVWTHVIPTFFKNLISLDVNRNYASSHMFLLYL